VSWRDRKTKTNISQGKIYVAHIMQTLDVPVSIVRREQKPALNLGSCSHKLRVNIIAVI